MNKLYTFKKIVYALGYVTSNGLLQGNVLLANNNAPICWFRICVDTQHLRTVLTEMTTDSYNNIVNND